MFAGKGPALESLFDNVAGLQAYNFIKRSQHKCFPVNTTKFLRAPFYRTLWLLSVVSIKRFCEILEITFCLMINQADQPIQTNFLRTGDCQ